jgi:hypothetical protein
MFWSRKKFRRHDFDKGTTPIQEEGVDFRWHRVWAECRRCGEQRKVYWAVPMDQLNAGECNDLS